MATILDSLSRYEYDSITPLNSISHNSTSSGDTVVISLSQNGNAGNGQLDELIKKNEIIRDDIKNSNEIIEGFLTTNVALTEKLTAILESFEILKCEKASLADQNEDLKKNLGNLKDEVASLSFISTSLVDENRDLTSQKDNLELLLTRRENDQPSASFEVISRTQDASEDNEPQNAPEDNEPQNASEDNGPQNADGSGSQNIPEDNIQPNVHVCADLELQAKYDSLLAEKNSLTDTNNLLLNQLQKEEVGKNKLAEKVSQLQEALQESEQNCRVAFSKLCDTGTLNCPVCQSRFTNMTLFEKHLQICVD